MDTEMMASEKFARHAERFGEAHSKLMKLSGGYNEIQCRECQHDHTCCDQLVACGPFEAMGILNYLKVTLGKEGLQGMLEVIKFRMKEQRLHAKSYMEDDGSFTEEKDQAMASDWNAKGKKCVFYDATENKCSIYSVRPVPCRRVFGVKNCSEEGVEVAPTHEWAEARRLTRVKWRPSQNPNDQHALMLDLIVYLAGMDGPVQTGITKREMEMFKKEPMLISDEFHIWGPDGPPVTLNPIDQGE